MFSTIVLCTIFVINSITLQAFSDREVLVDFYHSTSGPDWIRQDNWLLSDIHHCQWHGVLCNNQSQVEEIQLYDNELRGPLPETLSNLTQLKTLYLSFNSISGNLPSTIGKCSKLENIWLKANKVQGNLKCIGERCGEARKIEDQVLRSFYYYRNF
jgi:Leucine-rich repeat (LRR) protein